MKKIISLLAAALMLALLLPTAGAEEAGTNYERILLSGDNFNVPEYQNGGYINNGGTATGNLFPKSIKINGNNSALYSTAKVYIAKAGTYHLWLLSGNEAGDTVARCATIGVDGSERKELTKHKVHQWDKTEWTLTVGWHELQVGMNAAWSPVLVNALYLTNDTAFEPSKDNQSSLLVYADTAAPSFAADADVITSFEGGTTQVTFPKAEDANGVAAYEYSANGTAAAISDIDTPIVLSGLAGKTELTLTAYDKHGNSTEKTFHISIPKTKWMLTYHNFTLPNIVEWMIEKDISGLTNWLTPERKYIKMNKSNSAGYAETEIYVENEGDYALWLLSGSVSASATRFPKAGFDGKFGVCSETDGLTWKKCNGSESGSTTWHLTKGWHTLQLGLGNDGWNPTHINAVYVTSDLTETVTLDNDNALLASYVENSVLYNGKKYGTTGLELEGLVVEDSSVNIAPVMGGTTDTKATAAINGNSMNWDEPALVRLHKGVNAVSVSSSDSKINCEIPVVSLGSVVHHTEADITGNIESAYDGVNGEKAVYISGSGNSAKFYADGISGQADVYVYAIGAAQDSSAADNVSVTLKDAAGEKAGAPFNNNAAESGWIKVGSCRFSGKSDRSEYVEIKGQDGKNVYLDSVKFVYTEEYIISDVHFVNNGGRIHTVIDCYKQTDTEAVPAAVLAQYDQQTDALTNVVYENVSFGKRGICRITTSQSVEERSDSYCKLFLWDGMDTMKPAAPVYSNR